MLLPNQCCCYTLKRTLYRKMIWAVLVNYHSKTPEKSLLLRENAWQARKDAKTKDGWCLEIPTPISTTSWILMQSAQAQLNNGVKNGLNCILKSQTKLKKFQYLLLNHNSQKPKKYFIIYDVALMYWPRGFSMKFWKLNLDLHFLYNNEPIIMKSMKVQVFKNTSSIETHSVLHFSVPLGKVKPRYNKVTFCTKISSLSPIFTYS